MIEKKYDKFIDYLVNKTKFVWETGDIIRIDFPLENHMVRVNSYDGKVPKRLPFIYRLKICTWIGLDYTRDNKLIMSLLDEFLNRLDIRFKEITGFG